MNIGTTLPPEEPSTILYIGQHSSQTGSPLSQYVLGQVQELGYDFATTPITTKAFQSRVLKLVSEHLECVDIHPVPGALPSPQLSPLTPEDTTLTPDDHNTSLVAITSPWVDLGSSNAVIAHVSQQVFKLEVAYAAFCGVNNIIVPGPLQGANAVQFSRAIYEGLGLGPYLQLHVLLPVTGEFETDYIDSAHFSELAGNTTTEGHEYENEEELFAIWETWNTIRTICNYSHKLSIGMQSPQTSLLFDLILLFPHRLK